MNELHSLLKRQLRRFTGETESLPHEQANLFQAINDAYLQFDVERRMLEHSLELTSQELLEANAELSSRNTDLEMRVEARTAELSSSEARFRELFEHAPVSIWEEDFSAVREYIDDLRGIGVVDFSAYFDAHPEAVGESAARVKIVDVNRATLEMYQVESKEQLLADLSKVLGPESLIPFKEELLALTRGETSFENETINYTLRGERRVVFVRLTVAPGSEQTWAKVFVGISDITERRLAEAALAIERDLLQALMDNIPDTIYFKDTDSRFTRINRAQVNVLGIAAPEEAIGKTDFDFFQNAELVQSFYNEEQRIIETGQPLINRIEFNPSPDGKPRWFSATKVPIRNPDGRMIGIVGISRDITEQKQAEEARHESEETTRLIIDTALDAVITIDQDGQITRWNDQAETIFGWRRAEAVGQRLSELIIPPDLRAKHERGLKHYSETGEGPVLDKRIEITAQRRNGNIFPVELTIHVLKANNKVSFAAFVRDITERKQAEEALRQSEERFKLMA